MALAATGADLLLLGRSLEPLEKVAHEGEHLGRYAQPLRGDITQQREVAQAFHSLERLDILVNNARYQHF